MTSVARDGLLLAVDIGNTNVKVGVFEGQELVADWRLATDAQRTEDEYGAVLGVLLSHRGLSYTDLCAVSLSSTVPALVPTFRDLAAHFMRVDAPFLTVSADANTGVTIDIENPGEMGPDRIVDALAARTLYGVPAIIVDFGTATTFDAVDAEGRLVGTSLAPGFHTAMEGLFQRAARIPRIEVQRPETAIGRNTKTALYSGWVYGYVGLVEGLVARVKRELGGRATVIGTGGLSHAIVAETTVIDVHDPLLTLKGLRLFWELNR